MGIPESKAARPLSPEERAEIGIYFACALHGPHRGPMPDDLRTFYDRLAAHMREEGYHIYMPHEEIFGPEISGRELRKRQEDKISHAQVVVRYFDEEIVAIGADVEMSEAERFGVPIITVVKKGTELPTYAAGASRAVIYFESEEDLYKQLPIELDKLGDKWTIEKRKIVDSLHYNWRMLTMIVSGAIEVFMDDDRK